MKSYTPFFFVLLFLLIGICPGFPQEIIFNKVLPPKGNTFLQINRIVQDKQGYMWFATKVGLYYYDGYTMSSYKTNPLNPNSLVNNELSSICVDSSGIIWVGTWGAGLERLDPSTGIFMHFHFDPKDPGSLSTDSVTCLLQDHEGMLWVGTNGGLDRLDAKTGKFIHYRQAANDTTSISCDQVGALYEDHQGTLWVGTGDAYPINGVRQQAGGLNRFDKKAGKFLRYLHDPRNPHTMINDKVGAIFEDSKGTFWVGTAGDGLHTMDRASGTFERHLYDPAHPEKISRPPLNNSAQDHITFIKEDAAGGMWIGTATAGLNYYDPKTGKTTHYGSERDAIGAFEDKEAWCAYTSREGVLWIGTQAGNLYRIDPFQRTIPHYASPGSQPWSLLEEADMLWIGTEDGLFRKDLTTGAVKRFLHDPHNPASLSFNKILYLFKDSQGKIWISTYGGGLDLFNKENETFTHYRHNPKNNNSLSNDNVLLIYENSDANLWIATGMGLNLMNRKTGTFTRYFIDPNDTVFINPNDTVPGRKNFITYILKDRQGKWWIGSWYGLYQLNQQTGKFKDYLTGITTYSIYLDAKGDLWVGASNGLYLFDRTSDKFSPFVELDSLTSIPDVKSITEDNQRNLWICSSLGLIKLNAQRNRSIVYGSDYGVRGEDLVVNYCHKGPQGKLYFSDQTGYFAFYPEQLSKNPNPPEILITSFSLADQVVKPGKQGPLTESLLRAKRIQLHYNQNIFFFDFVAFDYSNPQGNRHLYMLENYDNTWRQAGSERRAYYFNVPPGRYTFRVKAANSNGVWTEKSVAVIITPPWWRTWWAYTLFALLFIIAVWSIIYYRSRNLIKEKRVLEKKVNDRTAEVVKQKEEIAVQRDNLKQTLEELKSTQTQLVLREKMASLGELTAGIAHEIQNPLNFVNNFSEVNKELLVEMNEEIEKGNLNEVKAIAKDVIDNEEKINHHGKRADTIVKGMLQHSRPTSSQKEATDINKLADEYLRLSYHGLRAKDKTFNATLQTDFDEDLSSVEGKINIVPQDIGRVLLNLYNNAFYAVNEKSKQQNENYEPTVSVNTKKLKGKVEISVKDNGNGIPQKVLAKIFQPFFTTRPTGQGTGLGLSLAYDIMKAHGGEIKVETKEGEFAEFIIQLPAGREK